MSDKKKKNGNGKVPAKMAPPKLVAEGGIVAPTAAATVAKLKSAQKPGAQPVSAEDLPDDAVALLVWREFAGSQPMTIVVTEVSWDMNKQVLMDNGMMFDRERIYEFESPTNPKGRKTTFYLADVIGWAANTHSNIIAAPRGLKV